MKIPKIYVLRNVPADVHDFEEGPDMKETTAMLMFTPDADAGYPLGIGIHGLDIMVTVPLGDLIEKVKNDMKEGKL